MVGIGFEWSSAKAQANKKKHGITFEEAIAVFYDERALLIADTLHSVGEDRFIILGRSKNDSILVVVHLYWEERELIRIISARAATRKECNQYFAR
ncbi:BrnT family toxin [Bdellovibrio sp. HCB2-146]|uniref:BrnT family toxin n=1 Tax=Bdellovibrio sp. HCB2-146 TaxID=3394362 RepID=UPI0039BD3EAA